MRDQGASQNSQKINQDQVGNQATNSEDKKDAEAARQNIPANRHQNKGGANQGNQIQAASQVASYNSLLCTLLYT